VIISNHSSSSVSILVPRKFRKLETFTLHRGSADRRERRRAASPDWILKPGKFGKFGNLTSHRTLQSSQA
jgi:hypothetical protein